MAELTATVGVNDNMDRASSQIVQLGDTTYIILSQDVLEELQQGENLAVMVEDVNGWGTSQEQNEGETGQGVVLESGNVDASQQLVLQTEAAENHSDCLVPVTSIVQDASKSLVLRTLQEEEKREELILVTDASQGMICTASQGEDRTERLLLEAERAKNSSSFGGSIEAESVDEMNGVEMTEGQTDSQTSAGSLLCKIEAGDVDSEMTGDSEDLKVESGQSVNEPTAQDSCGETGEKSGSDSGEPRIFEDILPPEQIKKESGYKTKKPVKRMIFTRSKAKNNRQGDNGEVICPMCERVFKTRKSLSSHIAVHTSLKCKICKEDFPTLSQRIAHQEKFHKPPTNTDRPYTCDICDKSFRIKSHLAAHKNIHLNDKPFICDQCGKGFSQVSNLNYHMSFCDEGGSKKENVALLKFMCKVCGKQLRSNSALQYHSKIHTKEKPFRCPHCSYAGRNKGTLEDHIFCRHLKNQYSHPCHYCNTGFHNSTELDSHLKASHKRKPKEKTTWQGTCDICEEKCDTKASLASHLLKKHGSELENNWWESRGLEVFPCKICSKILVTRSSHKQHVDNQHSQPRFSCETCCKTFHTKYNAQVHQRTHTGDKPYICKICSAAFSDPANLKHHHDKHAKVKQE